MRKMDIDLAGWFPEENQQTLEKLIEDHDIKTVVEVGCFLGRATAWFAERVDHVIVVDIFEPSPEPYLNTAEIKPKTENMYEQFMFNMKELGIADKISVYQMTSEQASKLVSGDLVYIDASHEYPEVKKDIQNWYGKANKVLCGDDNTPVWRGVQQAVREATEELPSTVNSDQRVWYTIKDGSNG